MITQFAHWCCSFKYRALEIVARLHHELIVTCGTNLNDNCVAQRRLDVLVGRRLQFLRREQNLNEHEFGSLLELAASEIRYFEVGNKRIAAMSLHLIASKLSVGLSYFFGTDRFQPSASNREETK